MNILFFGSLVLYFAAMALQFAAAAFKKEVLRKIAWYIFLGGLAMQTVYLIARGIIAHRIPLSNQFEFAATFAWGGAVLAAILRLRLKTDWLNVIAMPFTFMILSYVALRAKLPAEYTAATGLAATRSQTL